MAISKTNYYSWALAKGSKVQDINWESIWAGIQRDNIALEARNKVNKDILFDILEKNKVESVFVHFDGSGDSGGVETIEISPENLNPLLEETALGFVWDYQEWADVNGKVPEINLREAIETMCYDLLRFKHRGWEVDEGAFGNFDFDVKHKKIKLEFKERSISEYVDEL